MAHLSRYITPFSYLVPKPQTHLC